MLIYSKLFNIFFNHSNMHYIINRHNINFKSYSNFDVVLMTPIGGYLLGLNLSET